MTVVFMTDIPSLNADNSNVPLWKTVTLRIAQDEGYLASLAEEEFQALFAQAVAVMKPDSVEKQALELSREKQEAYALSFVRAYKTGIPPLSGISNAVTHPLFQTQNQDIR